MQISCKDFFFRIFPIAPKQITMALIKKSTNFLKLPIISKIHKHNYTTTMFYALDICMRRNS
jgi:hypothetical protein